MAQIPLIRLLRRLFLKSQNCTVHAVSQTGRLRPVIKNVSQMCIAAATKHFGSCHETAAVIFHFYVSLVHRLIKTGPTSPRFELVLAVEQRQSAADTLIDSVAVLVPVFAGECALGSFFSRDVELL